MKIDLDIDMEMWIEFSLFAKYRKREDITGKILSSLFKENPVELSIKFPAMTESVIINNENGRN